MQRRAPTLVCCSPYLGAGAGLARSLQCTDGKVWVPAEDMQRRDPTLVCCSPCLGAGAGLARSLQQLGAQLWVPAEIV